MIYHHIAYRLGNLKREFLGGFYKASRARRVWATLISDRDAKRPMAAYVFWHSICSLTPQSPGGYYWWTGLSRRSQDVATRLDGEGWQRSPVQMDHEEGCQANPVQMEVWQSTPE